MDLGIQGRVALVTGGSKGMGKAIALGLAQAGCRVAVSARGEAALKATGDEMRAATGAEVVALPGDMSRLEDIERVVQGTKEALGPIDILICNAGGPPPGKFADFGETEWHAALDQNLMSVVRLCRLVIPDMQAQRWGRILTITSLTVKQPSPTLVLSNVARAGVTALVKSLATEFGPDGILVNNLLPGSILTDRSRSLARRQADAEGVSVDDILHRNARDIPTRRIGTPEEFAALAVFLASEQASFISGVSIPVDGGALKALM